MSLNLGDQWEGEMNWKPIETAPRDGGPIWARGRDWGERNNDTHAGFVWWNGRAWVWAGHISNNLAIYVTEWLESPK